jgi:hypothetical protein
MAGAHIPSVKFIAWMCAWARSSRCTSTLVVSTYDKSKDEVGFRDLLLDYMTIRV